VEQRGQYKQGIIVFYRGKELKITSWEQGFVHHRIVSAVNRVEFVSDRVSYSSERSLV
jgi:hypothetical protein